MYNALGLTVDLRGLIYFATGTTSTLELDGDTLVAKRDGARSMGKLSGHHIDWEGDLQGTWRRL